MTTFLDMKAIFILRVVYMEYLNINDNINIYNGYLKHFRLMIG